jgi:2',3'-cyclic-nucleotide 2'-phosphodiesterase (5'-nucleotidase family)
MSQDEVEGRLQELIKKPERRQQDERLSRARGVLRPVVLSLAVGLLPAAGLVLVVSALTAPAASAQGGASLQLQSMLSGEASRTRETELGNLVADALRAATNADIAFVAAGELREEALAPGAVTLAQMQRLLVNGDETVTVLSLSGATIRDALEVAVGLHPRKSKGFIQVSGVQFIFDSSRPEGSRVVSGTVGGQPLQDGRQYRVSMSSSLAAGQYGYYRLWSREKGTSQGLTLAGALDQYLRTRRTVAPRAEGRIVARGRQ